MKAIKNKTAKSSKPTKSKNEEPQKVSKTWLSFLKASKNPGEILDMRAVLK